MITRTFGSLVAKISLREVSGFSSTVMPAAASSGKVSSKMRPFDSARISWSLLCESVIGQLRSIG